MAKSTNSRNPFLLQPSSDEILSHRTAALSLKTEPNDAASTSNTEPWTTVRSRRPTRSQQPENVPIPRERWSEQVDNDSLGPTPFCSVSSNPFLTVPNDRTSEKYTANAQASCYNTKTLKF